MQIVEIQWAPRVDIYIIRCDCGQKFSHRADAFRAVCPHCGKSETVKELKNWAGIVG
jgi:hypothetical protein